MPKLLSLRAERRRREARRETFTTPEMVTTRRSFLGPLAKGWLGAGNDNDDDIHDDDPGPTGGWAGGQGGEGRYQQVLEGDG